jgi:hypothetical protein
MNTSKKRELESERRRLQELRQLLEQLTPWDRFLVLQRVRWMVFRNKIKDIPITWVKFQLDLEDDLKRFGMPRKWHWQLVKWFNRQPFPDTNQSFICKGRRVWHHYFLEKYNFEFHLQYKEEFPGLIWFKIKRDGTAKVLSFNIGENFRNAGMGTFVFQESVKLLQDRVTCIRGVLQKKYHPKPEASLRWLRKQGFEITQKKNGDYEFEFWMNK